MLFHQERTALLDSLKTIEMELLTLDSPTDSREYYQERRLRELNLLRPLVSELLDCVYLVVGLPIIVVRMKAKLYPTAAKQRTIRINSLSTVLLICM